MRRVPATVITGFLGAGKTSLVRHLVAHAQDRRLAVIVNEFGELGIDRELLLGCGDATCGDDDIVELANGCLCCTVADEFLPTLTRLLDRAAPPEHILIETSGLALPKPLVQAFAWPEIRAAATVDGVLAVIDAAAVDEGRFATDPAAVAQARAADPALAHDNPLDEVFSDQLACADLVILNKTDLVIRGHLAALRREIGAKLRPGVRLFAARHGIVPPAVALGLVASAEDDLAVRPSLHDLEGSHDHDDFESFVVGRGAIGEIEGFLASLRAVIRRHGVLRLKGFVDVAGRERRLVIQAVGDRVQHYFDRPWHAEEERRTRLVVIGEKGLRHALIDAALVQ
ncbi:MAG: cobalamin biosynthesis protein CobW [Stellaceae bacterium]